MCVGVVCVACCQCVLRVCWEAVNCGDGTFGVCVERVKRVLAECLGCM